MAHEYLLRAFLTFSLLLLVNIGWYLAGPLIRTWWPAHNRVLTTPKQAIAAVAQVDILATQLRTSPAWMMLDKNCRHPTSARAPLIVASETVATVSKIPAILRPVANEAGVVQDIRLACGGAAIGRMRVWYISNRLAKLPRSSGLPDPLAVSASDTIVALKKYWPPTGPKDDPAKFPPMLFQQTVLRRDSDGRPIVLVITRIGPGVITLP